MAEQELGTVILFIDQLNKAWETWDIYENELGFENFNNHLDILNGYLDASLVL